MSCQSSRSCKPCPVFTVPSIQTQLLFHLWYLLFQSWRHVRPSAQLQKCAAVRTHVSPQWHGLSSDAFSLWSSVSGTQAPFPGMNKMFSGDIFPDHAVPFHTSKVKMHSGHRQRITEKLTDKSEFITNKWLNCLTCVRLIKSDWTSHTGFHRQNQQTSQC